MLSLALVWWFMLAGLGLVFPYWTLYLRENVGLSGTQVGAVAATLPLLGLVAQPFWGLVADRTGKRAGVLSVLCLGAAFGYVALGMATTFATLLLCTAVLALFTTALIPTCVSVSLAALDDGSATAFGRVRVMGTIGFAASVGLFPLLLRAVQRSWPADTASAPGAEPHLVILFYLTSAMLLLAFLFSLGLKSGGAVSLRAERGDWRLLLHSGPFLRVLAFTFLSYLFIQGPMVLFPILVRAQGGGLEAISQMWILMLALEVPLVFYFGASISRAGPRGVIAIGIAASAVRWGVSGFVEDLSFVYVAQLLHGVTVWGIILGVPLYVDRCVPERLRSTAQGLLAMIGVSLGSILSNLGAGWLTEVASAKAPAQIAAIASIFLTLALPFVLPELAPHAEAKAPRD